MKNAKNKAIDSKKRYKKAMNIAERKFGKKVEKDIENMKKWKGNQDLTND